MLIFKAKEYQSEKSPIFDSQKSTKPTSRNVDEPQKSRVISWTTESISTMVNYTLWVCCNQPRATFNHRVKHQTFQTKFLCKTINTARFLKASAFFTAIICPFWFKTSKVMTLLTFCINNYRPIDGKTLFSICNQR